MLRRLSFFTVTLSCILLPSLLGMTPNEQFLRAAHTNNVEQAQKAFNAGAHINAQDSNGCTPLMQAIRGSVDRGKYTVENITMVKLLLGAGADINVHDHNNCTALHYALYNKCTRIAELLINAGADSNARSNKGSTPLHYAVASGNIYIVKLLIDAGADLNAQDDEGYTPLDRTLEVHATYIAKFLLDAGAHINAKVYDDWATSYTINSGLGVLFKDYLDLLEHIKLQPAKDLLTQAIDRGYVHAVKLLLKAGIKPEVQDLALAKQNYNQDIRPLYKESYATIGRMLVHYLRLTGKIQAPAHKRTVLTRLYHVTRRAFGSTTQCTCAPISKAGLGLPENIAHTIASFTYPF